MGVNANPPVRVTAVIGDHVQKRAWKGGEADKEPDEARNKAKASHNARLSRGGLKMS